MFKIKDLAQWNETEAHMMDDIGGELVDDLGKEIIDLGHTQATADHISYYPDDLVVGAETYDVAVMDAGRAPGEYPPANVIREWVIWVKDGGANRSKTKREINNITWAIMEKIKHEGIDPTWFVKDVLNRWSI